MKLKSIVYFIVVQFLVQNLFAQHEEDLVDITSLDSTIIIDLRYATADNFMKEVLYSANICLLRKTVAEKLIKVQQDLRRQGLGLKVWDGYRPLSVQKKMWEKMPNPGYVADPKYGSNHNRGAAVDVTLVDSSGNELEMPTGFDDFTKKAASNYPYVTKEAFKNRKMLQEAMKAHGFKAIKSEWWHFNDCDVKKYPVIDIPLKKIVTKSPGN